jgi:hypothetical protein
VTAATSWVRLVNAQLRYYMHVDPDLLSDDQWARMWQDLQWIRKREKKESLLNRIFWK